MDSVFLSTHWRDSNRDMMLNIERILTVERAHGNPVTYVVTFDNGHVLVLDEETGRIFYQKLAQVDRPTPTPIYQAPRSDYREPRLPRRIR